MTVVKTPDSDPTGDAYVEIQTVTLSSGSVTVTFDAPFSERPKVAIGARTNASNTRSNAEIDADSTFDKDEVTVVGDTDTDVDVIAIGT